MTATIVDLLESMVAGEARAAELEAEFQKVFYGPLVFAQQVQLFLEMGNEDRALVRHGDPQLYERLVEQEKKVRSYATRQHP